MKLKLDEIKLATWIKLSRQLTATILLLVHYLKTLKCQVPACELENFVAVEQVQVVQLVQYGLSPCERECSIARYALKQLISYSIR